MFNSNRVFVLALALSSICASGCYNMVPIRTTELPQLNDMHVTPVGSTVANGQVVSIVESSVRSVHRPDGRTVRITGAPDVDVTTSAGTVRFREPVISSLQPGQSLTVAGANRSAVTIPLDEIELVEARVYSPAKSTAWALVGILVGSAIAGTVTAALVL